MFEKSMEKGCSICRSLTKDSMPKVESVMNRLASTDYVYELIDKIRKEVSCYFDDLSDMSEFVSFHLVMLGVASTTERAIRDNLKSLLDAAHGREKTGIH